MLGEVVGAVKLPQAADLVHQAVVPVEPEVEDDAVEPGLERHPGPAHVGGGLGGAVGEEDGEDGAEGGRRDERAHHLPDADVGDAVALVGVAVEEAVPVAHGAEHVDLADGDELEGDAVEEEGLEGCEVDARVLDVEVVQDEGDGCVDDDPAVHQPVGQVGHLFGLLVHGDVVVQVGGMHVDDFVEPVREVPLPPVLAPPGRLHRVFGVGLGVGHGGRRVSVSRADAFFSSVLLKKKKEQAGSQTAVLRTTRPKLQRRGGPAVYYMHDSPLESDSQHGVNLNLVSGLVRLWSEDGTEGRTISAILKTCEGHQASRQATTPGFWLDKNAPDWIVSVSGFDGPPAASCLFRVLEPTCGGTRLGTLNRLDIKHSSSSLASPCFYLATCLLLL